MRDGGRKDKAAAAAVAASIPPDMRGAGMPKSWPGTLVPGKASGPWSPPDSGCAGKNDGGAGMAAAGTPGMGAFGAPTPSNV